MSTKICNGILTSGEGWSAHDDRMDDRELLIRFLAELQQLRQMIKEDEDEQASLTLEMVDLEEVVIQEREDIEETRERAEALLDYLQDLVGEATDEPDAEFTDGETESESEDEDTESDEQGRDP